MFSTVLHTIAAEVIATLYLHQVKASTRHMSIFVLHKMYTRETDEEAKKIFTRRVIKREITTHEHLADCDRRAKKCCLVVLRLQ